METIPTPTKKTNKTTMTKKKKESSSTSSLIDEGLDSQSKKTTTTTATAAAAAASTASSKNKKSKTKKTTTTITTKKPSTAVASKVSRKKKTNSNNNHKEKDDVDTTSKSLLHTMTPEQEQVHSVWLPHLERYDGAASSKSILSTERTVSDMMHEFHQLIATHTTIKDVNETTTVTKTYREAAQGVVVHYLDCILSTNETDTTQTVLQVLVEVSIQLNSTECLVKRAFEFTRVLLDRIRGHAVTFLRIVASTILSLPNLDQKNDILDSIVEALTVACTDKSKLVRQAAIRAAQPFLGGRSITNNGEEDAAVEEELLQSILWILQHDPIAPNRVTAIQVLPLTAQTSDYLVGRIRDLHATVRVAVLHKFREDPNSLDLLDSELMATMLQTGYTERCDETRQAALDLVHTWLQKNDTIQILRKLNVLLYETQCELLVKIVLQLQSSQPAVRQSLLQTLTTVCNTTNNDSSKENPTIDVEGIFLVRVVCQQNPQFVDQVGVDWDVTRLTAVLEEQVHHLRQLLLHEDNEDDTTRVSSSMNVDHVSLVCQQWILLASTLASQEEGSTRHVRHVVSHLLSDPVTPDVLIATILQALYALQTNTHNNTTRNGSGGLDETTQLVVECIRKLQQQQTSNHDDMMREYYQIRTLSIWNVLLEHLMADALTSDMETLIQQVLEPVLQTALDSSSSTAPTPPLVRQAAVSCVGKLGLVWCTTKSVHNTANDDRLHQYQSQLIQLVLQDDNDDIRVQALLALADWSLVSRSNSDIVEAVEELILALLENDNNDDLFFVCVAAEVTTKLLLAHKPLTQPHQLLARLIQLSFDATLSSVTEDEAHNGDCEIGSPIRIQQLLSLFFASYALTSTGRQGLIQCLPSLLTLTQKKTARMVSYVYDIVQQGSKSDEPSQRKETSGLDVVSLDMAIEMATFLFHRNPSGAFLRTVCKVLGGLSLVEGNEPPREDTAASMALSSDIRRRLSQLYQLIEELGMALDDPTALNTLGYLQETLVLLKADHDLDSEPRDTDSDNRLDEEDGHDGADSESSGSDVDTSTTETVASEAPASEKPLTSDVMRSSVELKTEAKSGKSFSMTDFFGAIDKENTTAAADTSLYHSRRSADSHREPSMRGSKRSSDINSTVSVLATLDDDEPSARRRSSSRVGSISTNSQDDTGSTATSRVNKPRRTSKPTPAESVLAMFDGEASASKPSSSRPSKSRIHRSSNK